jgi:hypothetical protein
MTIATEKLKPSSIKYFLVRMTPARHISTLLASDGGGVYSYSWDRPVSSLERNGVELTQVSLNPPTVDDTYYFDEATATLKVKLASAPSSSTNVIVMYYRLFFSDNGGIHPETPDDTTTTMRNWEPWIVTTPRIRMQFSDQTYGVLSTQASAITMINPDRFFQQLLTENDSFFRKRCEIWAGINDSVVKVFSGPIQGLSMPKRGNVTVALRDASGPLQKAAFMGDSADDALTPTNDVVNKYSSKPIPYVFGRSRHKFAADGYTVAISTGANGSKNIDFSNCNRASYVGGISRVIDGTTNRGPWAIARTGPEGFKTLNFGTVSEISVTSDLSIEIIDHLTYDWRFGSLLLSVGSGYNLEIGDSFTWSHPGWQGGALQYACVIANPGTGVFPGEDLFFLYVKDADSSVIYGGNFTATSGFTINSNQAPAVVLTQPGKTPYMLFAGLDFTTSVTTLPSGNKYMEITLVNNFETATDSVGQRRHANLDYVDLGNTEIFFRVTQNLTNEPNKHGNAVAEILTQAGLDVDTAAITAANAALDVNCSFTIPAAGESKFEPYYSYLQRIVQSTLGYITFDAEQQAIYQLVEAAAAGGRTIDDYNSWSHSADLGYSEIVSEILPNNEHVPTTASSSASALTRYLHSGDAKLQLEHVLEDIAPRIDAILEFRSKPFVKYSARASHEFIEEFLGGDVAADLSEILGSTTSKDLKLTAIEISKSGIYLEAAGFEGL